MKNVDLELKTQISEYMQTQKLMSMATFADNEPWIANVYFVSDDDLNIYFLSKKWREHCKAIVINPKVSVAIADSHQNIYNPQKGLQITGTAEEVNVFDKLEWMFKMWNKLIAGEKGEKLSDPKKFLDAGVSGVYRIKPSKIKFFNTEAWPKDQTKVLELS